MDESGDLRKILSLNIKQARNTLHITQAKLAERAGISVYHIIEIEQCKTSVSDKTLAHIAQVFGKDAYELLLPNLVRETHGRKGKRQIQSKIAELIKEKKDSLRQKTVEDMEDLTLEIMQLFDKSE